MFTPLLTEYFTLLEARIARCTENHSFTQCLVVHNNQHLQAIHQKINLLELAFPARHTILSKGHDFKLENYEH